MTVERVTFTDVDGKRRTVRLRDPQVAGSFLVGDVVDKNHTLVNASAAFLQEHHAEFGTVRRMIETDLVVRRVEVALDPKYGTEVIV